MVLGVLVPGVQPKKTCPSIHAAYESRPTGQWALVSPYGRWRQSPPPSHSNPQRSGCSFRRLLLVSVSRVLYFGSFRLKHDEVAHVSFTRFVCAATTWSFRRRCVQNVVKQTRKRESSLRPALEDAADNTLGKVSINKYRLRIFSNSCAMRLSTAVLKNGKKTIINKKLKIFKKK